MGNRGAVDGASVLYRTRHDEAAGSTICETVIDALSEVDEADPAAVADPLHDSVDLNALDRLFGPRFDGTPRTTKGHVEFTIRGRRVVVHSDGEILICRGESFDGPSF